MRIEAEFWTVAGADSVRKEGEFASKFAKRNNRLAFAAGMLFRVIRLRTVEDDLTTRIFETKWHVNQFI